MKLKFFFFSLCFFWAHAIDIGIGYAYSPTGIWVEDPNFSNDEIARMEEGVKFSPHLAILSSPYYLWDTGWGFHLEANGRYFSVERQDEYFGESEVDEKTKNYGTKINGWGLYLVPLLYYHFWKNDIESWNFKTGIGIGAGYTDFQGNFEITNSKHPLLGTKVNVSEDSFVLSVGLYLRVHYGNWSVFIQNYVNGLTKENDYEYKIHNGDFGIRYKITSAQIWGMFQ